MSADKNDASRLRLQGYEHGWPWPSYCAWVWCAQTSRPDSHPKSGVLAATQTNKLGATPKVMPLQYVFQPVLLMVIYLGLSLSCYSAPQSQIASYSHSYDSVIEYCSFPSQPFNVWGRTGVFICTCVAALVGMSCMRIQVIDLNIEHLLTLHLCPDEESKPVGLSVIQ